MVRFVRICLMAAVAVTLAGATSAYACDSEKAASAENASATVKEGCSSTAKAASAVKEGCSASAKLASAKEGKNCSASAKLASAKEGKNCSASAKLASAKEGCSSTAKAASAVKEGCSASAKLASAKEGKNCSASAKLASAEGKACTAEEMAACAEKANMTSAECAAKCAAKKAAMANCEFHKFVTELHTNAAKVKVNTVEHKDGVTVVFAAVGKDDVVTAQTVASKAYAMMSAPAHCSVSRADMASKSCDGCKSGVEAFADAEITIENTENGAEAVVKTKAEDNVPTLHAFFQGLNPADPAGE